MDAISRSTNWFLKGIALLALYIFLGHPSVYPVIWERKNWYVILLAVPMIPLLLFWSAQVLVWRVRVNSSTIEIRSLRGVLNKSILDISDLERTPGRISVAFRDGYQRAIPAAIVGDLDDLLQQIASRRPSER
jgi:hypothetical protein